LNPFESARKKYRPKPLKTLLIAEAPPSLESERFFYFEQVASHDALFLEMMKVLYGCEDTQGIRKRKQEFLERFKNDGFYLIDAEEAPLPQDAAISDKKTAIRNSLKECTGFELAASQS